MTFQSVVDAVPVIALVVATASAVYGVFTYKHNTRTKAAEFLMTFHESFFVKDTYRTVRSILDNDSEQAQAKLSSYVAEEPGEFTDFLNFFELVAFMHLSHILSQGQVEALLGYYLNCLADKPAPYLYS